MSVKVESSSPHTTLEGILHHHLRLEPVQEKESGVNPDEARRKRSLSQPPLSLKLEKNSKPVVNRSTIESDNKRRPGILKRTASKYEPPPPEPPDPNSEAKSVTIHRMQKNLDDWDKQFGRILEKKEKNDSTIKNELEQRDKKIEDLSEKYSIELNLRIKTEKDRNQLSQDLSATQEELLQTRAEADELQNELVQYQAAYQESEIKRAEWENEAKFSAEQLEKSEGMRRRLNDQVTELQGQLAIEEQRSKYCVII